MSRLTLVQTPAPAEPARISPHMAAVRGAWVDGHHMGVRRGYTQGWRYGVACGALATLCACVVGAGVIQLLLAAGWLPW